MLRTILINTVHHVRIEYELAAAMSRVIAFILDMVLVLVLWFLFIVSFNAKGPEIALLFLLPLTVFLFYYFFAELLMDGQTLGKKIMGLKVVRLDGERLTPGDLLLRTFFLLPDAWFSLGIPAILLINTSSKAQRLGDMVAQTVVILTTGHAKFGLKDILNIQTSEKYTPRFPGVRRLPERDMLLIKDTIFREYRYKNPAHKQAMLALANRCRSILNIEEETKGIPPRELLEILLKDYIVLTR